MSKGLGNILEEVVSEFRPFLLERQFVEKGKRDFVKKIKSDFNRQEKITFSGRLHRSDSDAIYIDPVVGIYYPSVKKIEKFFIDDHLSKYPVVAGSISHFSERNIYLSVLYKTGINLTEVVKEIHRELDLGAFTLLSMFPTLESIYLGVIHKHPFLYKFHRSYDERKLLTMTCIILLLYGKEKAMEWTKESFIEGHFKDHIIERLLVFEFKK
ncbi:hypothetical protein [Flavobacterium cerinum]|uniref:Uncharacterized protein n=1 Tax=Flavobacterium cerinum TaxID=2502784 RepID=A0A444GL90_9FLAO|nr:hypothetical protein [Flavobacterium cerinum]RWW91785.1 hypothetical protein EPI11_18045 [Flavobacterium cerinum]